MTDREDRARTKETASRVSHAIIGAAIEVHRHLGPGLLESLYEEALCRELWLRRVAAERQVALPVSYKGARLATPLRIDVVVERVVLIEIKAVERIAPIHRSQVLTYLKLTGLTLGLLINFNSTAAEGRGPTADTGLTVGPPMAGKPPVALQPSGGS